MAPIKTVGIIGLGAVGINFASMFRANMEKDAVWIIADELRCARYETQGIYYNGERCDFSYHSPSIPPEPVDLLIFCTKFMGLQAAMEIAAPFIDSHTILMSAINGISSEEVLAQKYEKEQIVYAVAQGMDATKVDNRVRCQHQGEFCFGDASNGRQGAQIETVKEFFDRVHFPYTIKANILHHQWGKFMFNVGLNQVVALHHGTYETVQREGWERIEMLTAMREVQRLSEYEGIHLSEAEVMEWASMLDGLAPEGKPSMAQDVEAKRKTEVELFAYEVIKRAENYSLSCPLNTYLAKEITKLETSYFKMEQDAYQCGVMDAFAEVVGAGVKQLALSHPFASEAELQGYVPYAKKLCDQYQIECFIETDLLLTDLFPVSMNQGKCNLVFCKEERIREQYETLKRKKQHLIATNQYHGEKRKEIAFAFGALLSYDKESCEKKIKENQEKELI